MSARADSVQLWDGRGRRKYLTLLERTAFLQRSHAEPADVRLFCQVMAMTGARISEVLNLTPEQIDAGNVCIVFRTLKRRKEIYRAVPVPSRLMRELIALTWTMPRSQRIWPWCRQTAWSRVKGVMAQCRIEGAHATPKGLRHGFGLAAANQNVPLTLIAKWMGHSSTETTMIYLEVMGEEERRFAKRLWQDYTRP